MSFSHGEYTLSDMAHYSSKELAKISDSFERQKDALEPRLGKRIAGSIAAKRIRSKYPGALEQLRAKASAERKAGKRPARHRPKRGLRAVRTHGLMSVGDLRLGESIRIAPGGPHHMVTEAPRVGKRRGRNVTVVGLDGRRRSFEPEVKVKLVKGPKPEFHRRGHEMAAQPKRGRKSRKNPLVQLASEKNVLVGDLKRWASKHHVGRTSFSLKRDGVTVDMGADLTRLRDFDHPQFRSAMRDLESIAHDNGYRLGSDIDAGEYRFRHPQSRIGFEMGMESRANPRTKHYLSKGREKAAMKRHRAALARHRATMSRHRAAERRMLRGGHKIGLREEMAIAHHRAVEARQKSIEERFAKHHGGRHNPHGHKVVRVSEAEWIKASVDPKAMDALLDRMHRSIKHHGCEKVVATMGGLSLKMRADGKISMWYHPHARKNPRRKGRSFEQLRRAVVASARRRGYRLQDPSGRAIVGAIMAKRRAVHRNPARKPARLRRSPGAGDLGWML